MSFAGPFRASLVFLLAAAGIAAGQSAPRRPLGAGEADAIARLVMMEDRRQLDTADVKGLIVAPHPEIRRRAAVAIGRILDRRGLQLLRARPADADTAVAATVVFAVGQFRDTLTIPWFDSLLSNAKTAPTVATEAAVALGKIKTARARAVLAKYLSKVASTPRTNETIAEALLSIGRAIPRGDNSAILKWTKSPIEELRWRATWALFRPRDPSAVTALLALSDDPSGLVRSWAIRALTKPQADSANLATKAEVRLLVGLHDSDRRVRTEAVRALATYSDSAAVAALVTSLASTDSWISIGAAEGLGRIRSVATVASLVAATSPRRSCAVRLTAMQALQPYAPSEATAAAVSIARDTVPLCRLNAVQALMRDTSSAGRDGAVATVDSLMRDPVLSVRSQALQAHFTLLDAPMPVAVRRAGRVEILRDADPIVRAAALRSMVAWADSTDLPMLFAQYDQSRADSTPVVASAAVAVVAAVQRRQGVGGAAFLARFTAPENSVLRRDIDRAFGAAARAAWGIAPLSARTLADYRRIVDRWVIPDYNGAPRPTSRWETPRGVIDLELYPGDAPLATDDFVRTIEAGTIVGTDFSRVVPDFVDQQRTIRDGNVLRDEVNRHRLSRGNLSWASAGLDTGSPGYTLNHTPQPHNEGDFTSLGRVIAGQDVVDRIELGDRILAATMTRKR